MQIPDRSIHDSKDGVIRLNVSDIISHVCQGSLPSCRLFTIHIQGFLISNSVPHIKYFIFSQLASQFMFTYVVSTSQSNHSCTLEIHLEWGSSVWNGCRRDSACDLDQCVRSKLWSGPPKQTSTDTHDQHRQSGFEHGSGGPSEVGGSHCRQ